MYLFAMHRHDAQLYTVPLSGFTMGVAYPWTSMGCLSMFHLEFTGISQMPVSPESRLPGNQRRRFAF